MRVDGTINATSEPFPDYGKAVASAIEYGFRPAHDDWVVIVGGWYTHYKYGEPPLSIPPQDVHPGPHPTPSQEMVARDTPPQCQIESGLAPKDRWRM